MTTFRNPLADPLGTHRGPLWSADPSLKTAAVAGCHSRYRTDRLTVVKQSISWHARSVQWY